MRFLEFREVLKYKVVFNYNDIRKFAPGFHRRQLINWQKAGYIIKVRQGYYCFAGQEKSKAFLFFLANQLYKPTYVSLSGAMAFYNLIPEAVFSITSTGTLKTTIFDTKFGRFEYRHIKPSLFFGYQIVKQNDITFKIAEPEKMILDYCYLLKPNSIEDFESLRINRDLLNQLLDLKKFNRYLSKYQSPVMNKRSIVFKTYLNA